MTFVDNMKWIACNNKGKGQNYVLSPTLVCKNHLCGNCFMLLQSLKWTRIKKMSLLAPGCIGHWPLLNYTQSCCGSDPNIIALYSSERTENPRLNTWLWQQICCKHIRCWTKFWIWIPALTYVTGNRCTPFCRPRWPPHQPTSKLPFNINIFLYSCRGIQSRISCKELCLISITESGRGGEGCSCSLIFNWQSRAASRQVSRWRQFISLVEMPSARRPARLLWE